MRGKLMPRTGISGLKREMDRLFDGFLEFKWDECAGARRMGAEPAHRVERSYGAFTRSVRLPVGVEASKVNASFKNRLLTVTLPKTPASKGTSIKIKAE